MNRSTLSLEEAKKILVEWNDTSAPYPKDACIHQLFEEQVRRTPEAIAVVFEGETLNYYELDRRAQILANFLIRRGVGPSSLVPLCLERSFEMVVGILGVLKAGGAYVPLEASYPDNRLAYVLRDTSARVVLTQARFASRLEGLSSDPIEIAAIDWDWNRKERELEGGEEPNINVTSSDPAYVIYTSGTTGRPKGVVLAHRPLVNRVVWMQKAYELQPNDRVLQKTPYSFDVSGWEFFWPLIVGARIVLARPEGHKDPAYLRDIIRSEQITVLHFVPSMLRLFLAMEGACDCVSLKKVICSGEALPTPLKDRFFEVFQNQELHNLYGPTEAAIDVSFFQCRKEDRIIPIGKPIANTQLYIVDSEMNPVKAGVAGELCIGGDCLARGYLNQSDLTAERFVANPFKAGEKLYRTGDSVRWLPDGNIEYLGRTDHQIKIRGNRVELGEIESVILEVDGVGACTVVTLGEHENLKLAAYVVPEPRSAGRILNQLWMANAGRLDGVSLHSFVSGLEVAHLNVSETEFLYREIFENNAYLKHGIGVEAGDCVFDVGANIGLFSLSLLLSREAITIHAFEPIPDVFQVLKANAELFGGDLVLHPCGLSDHSGVENFTYYPHVSILSGAAANQAEEMAVLRQAQSENFEGVASAEIDELMRNRLEARTVRCQLKTLSEVIRERGVERIDLLKIDVEKLEAQVLRGIEEGDWAKIKQTVIEVHDVDGRLQWITSLLKGKGFEVVYEADDLLGDSRIFQVYARKETNRSVARTNLARKWHGQGQFIQAIRDHLRSKLPDYMVPAAIVPLAELPLTENGKIDRKSLAKREFVVAKPIRPALPRSVIEERILGIWEELLGIVDAGVEDGFFDLGGNSLLAVSAAERISKQFNCRFSVVSFLKHASVRKISAEIAERLNSERESSPSGIPEGKKFNGSRPSNVELIEAALNRHPSIQQSVVVSRKDGQGAESLVAFAIPNMEYFKGRKVTKDRGERLDQWISVWERNYQPIVGGEISSEKKINTIGYVRSDSGEQIPDEEIRECIDLAVSQVMDHKPKCILEIGCGTGMLLFQFASRVEQYLATDLSQNAIDHISASLEDKSYKDRVHCFRCDASDLTIVPIEKADTVVIHSVAQYFPSIDYLTHLIESLARRLPPNARIFIGDVRDLRLLRAFHVWTLQRQCAPITSKRRFRKLLADRIKLEKELVINPGYFKNLGETIPRIKQVRINPKMGKFQNEFVRFRYDVFLYLDEGTAEGVAPAVQRWSPSDSALEDYLRMASKGPLFLTDIPNKRLSKEIAYMEWLDSPGDEAPISEIRGTPREKSDEGIDPFECLKRGAAEGITATLHTEQGFEDGRFQLYLQPDGSSGALPRSLNYGPSEKMLNHGANFPSFALDWEEHVPILKKALSEELPGCTVPSRFIFVNEFPLLRNGEINRNELAGEKGPAAQAPPVKDPEAIDPEYYDQSVAIIGISCSFPGAEHHEKFWKNLCEGIESSRLYSIEELRAMGVSEDRIANPHFVPVGMGIEGKANFDPDYFNLSPRQAENMDPQARMLLQHSWQAIEEAGYAPRSIPETSVFMSAGNNYYQQALGLAERELQGMDGHEAGQLGQPGMIPAWISYSLGLKGPSFFVQSLCSSSMTGLHLAWRSLLSKEVQYALVGAANLFAPNKVGYLYEPGLNLSRDGHCRSFDAAADGMVEGEGVCVVVLKRAREAIQDRDHIYALLRGVGLSQDGADKVGFSAPSLRGQSEAVRKVLQETGVPVETIRYVEAHGTGTPLGDSIEVAALTEGYQHGTSKKQFCGLGSTKPNIGNLDTVTGLVGCVKIALSLNKGEFPPVVNHRTSNPEICFEESPFYVVGKTETWNPGQQPIRIAQHVYSLGGTNAHAIYEEHRRGKRAKALGAIPILVPLSARTRERLQAYARKLSEFLAVLNQTSRDDEAEYLADLAYTLQVGREPMDHRVLFQVQDLEGLKEKLSQFANGTENGEGVFCGEVSRKRDLLQLIGDEPDRRAFAQQRIAEGKWDKVANLWIRGVELDWNLIYGEQLPDRISLPTYPFLEEPYWLAQSKHLGDTGSFTTKIPERPASAGTDSITVLERVDLIVRAAISDLLGLPAEELDANRVFNESGFDSVSLIRLTNQLNQDHHLNLTPAVLFEHSTIYKLVRYLAEVKGAAFPTGQNQNGSKTSWLKVIEEVKAVSTTVGPPERGDGKAERIAVVGMSGRFPQAADLEAFWENLKAGRDCISEVPPDRWSWEEYYGDPDEDPTKTKIKWGGFMDGVGEFDPLFFNLSPREAEGMDPQNRLLMMYVWLAMEDAGYSASSISGTNTGLFIGTGDTGYAGLVASEKRRPDYGFLGVYPFSGPNRMSYFLNLNGPSEPINTGCSSSLVAVHKAVVALETGACDMAFAGGVNTVPTPDGHISFSKVGMLCEDGRCKAFGSQANGFVRGEGAGILVLKRLSDAEAAGDHIYGVILSSAENHGGRSNSFTAPNPVAQAQLLETAYRKAGIDPRTVGYIETHGTGTKLGDPVEVEGLKKAFQSLAPNRVEGEQAFCGLGSVKSNIGHLEMAAGIAGLIKVLLQLKHKTLVPTLHCHEVNPLIQIEGSPFYIVQEAGKWRTVTDAQGRELPRRAGVSSFGVGGVNAHVVIEEYLPRLNFVEGIETKNEPFLIVLSAKKKEALQEAAGRLLGYLKKRPELRQVELRNIAYTLQAGREAMEERVAFVAKTQSSLVLALGRFLDGHESFDHGFRGHARQVAVKESGVSDALIDARDFKSAAAFWVTGGIVDWPKMYCAPLPTRTSLPGYPFARERYWAVPTGRKEVVTNEIASLGRNCDPARDGWQASQVLESVDWVEQLRRCGGKRITILYTDERDKNQFRQLLQQMSEAARLTTPLRLRSVSVEELDSEEFGHAPEAIFILLGPSETKFPIEVNRILRRELSAKEIQIFVLHTGRLAGETEIPADEQHQWKLVECSENQISPSGQQLLLREWLAGARNELNRGTPLFIRYESSQRFEWKGPISIPNHFLEKKWKPRDLPQQAANSLIGVTLVFVNEESVGLLPILNLQKPVLVGSSRVQSNRTDFIVDFADEASAALNIPDMLKACASVERIIDLSDLYRTPRDYDEEKFGKLALYQALIGLFVPCQILHFTQGLQAFEAKQMSLAGAKFGGLVKMLSAEYSHIGARTIDIDSEAFEKTGCFAEIVDAESQKNGETEICYRQGKRYVPFLVAESQKHFERTFSLRSDGVYIVTGGTRGIGFEIAKHLVSSGARKLVLLGIRSLPPKAEWQRAAQDGELSADQRAQLNGFIELDQKLDQFEIYTGPLTDRKSLGEFFAGIRSRWGVIKGVIHSAGVYSEAHSSAFVTRDFARMRNVFEPKVRGTEQLHELLRFDDLDFFVSFSSLTGLIPRLARGLSDYAMANAFLDYFSAYQFHQNRRVCYRTITWVDWNEAGFAARMASEELERLEGKLREIGLISFSNRAGLRFFDLAMKTPNRDWVLPCALNLEAFNPAQPELLFGSAGRVAPVKITKEIEPRLPERFDRKLEEWEMAQASGISLSAEALEAFVPFEEIKRLDPARINRVHALLFPNTKMEPRTGRGNGRTEISEVIRKNLFDVLKIRELSDGEPFQNYGLDSISAMVFSNRLEKELKREVQPGWLIDFPTVETLALHLERQMEARRDYFE